MRLNKVMKVGSESNRTGVPRIRGRDTKDVFIQKKGHVKTQ